MYKVNLKTNLEYRIIERQQDKDYFIETLSYPINLEITVPYFSRLQFPDSRAILVRTTPQGSRVTIHIMRDVDLHSSFVNFEIELMGKMIEIMKEEGYIALRVIDAQ
ncbi:MAG: hypothetical protein ACRC1P_03835, partial [Cellulosilyticaceae bacterium]